MKILTFLIFISTTAIADEYIIMNNGMTCFKNDSGFTYGCSGGAPTGDTGFNDIKTGTRYERINRDQSINTQTGQPIYTPDYDENGWDDQD